MALKKFLGGFALHSCIWSKVVPGEKERKHGCGGQFMAVGRPNHAGKRVAVHRMDDGGAGFIQAGQIHPGEFKRPTWRSVAAREAAPYILVGINKKLYAVLVRFFNHGANIADVFVVIFAGTGVFNRFPGDQETQEIQAPGF
jgi:hypothetical protein